MRRGSRLDKDVTVSIDWKDAKGAGREARSNRKDRRTWHWFSFSRATNPEQPQYDCATSTRFLGRNERTSAADQDVGVEKWPRTRTVRDATVIEEQSVPPSHRASSPNETHIRVLRRDTQQPCNSI